MTKSTGKERHKLCWNLHVAWSNLNPIFGKSVWNNRTWLLCTRGTITEHSTSPKSAEFFSCSRSSNQPVRRNTKLGSWSTKKALKEGGLVPSGFEGNTGRQHAVYFTLVNPMDKSPDKKYKACKHSNPHHDAIYVADMEGAQKDNFTFYRTHHGCVICFAHQESHPHQGHDRYRRQDTTCSGTHTVGKRCKCQRRGKETQSISCAHAIREDTLLDETFHAIREQRQPNKVATRSKQQIPGYAKDRKHRRGPKDFIKSPAPELQHGTKSWATHCVHVARRWKTCGKSKIRRLQVKLRGNIHGKSNEQQYGKDKDHNQKAVTKGVNIGNITESERERERGPCSSIAERWDHRPDLSQVSAPTAEHEKHGDVWGHITTAQDESHDPKHQRTKAGNEELWVTWRRSSKKRKEDPLASQLIRERSHARVKAPRTRKSKETSEGNEDNSPPKQKIGSSEVFFCHFFRFLVAWCCACSTGSHQESFFGTGSTNTHMFTDAHLQTPQHIPFFP